MRDHVLLERAKTMRKELTEPERGLWNALRAKRLGGAGFRRQVVIGKAVADFACRSPRMVVVEVDGETHSAQQSYDTRRTAELERRGYRVMRFTNLDVMTNLEGVLIEIEGAVFDLPLSPTLSPEGERE